MRSGKVWGSTEVIISNPFVEVHRIHIEPNAHCSLHCHEKKVNAFFVISGSLKIEVHKNDYNLVDTTELTAGQRMAVKPKEYHRFISGPEPVEAIEIYYPEPLSEDIVRKDHGGANQLIEQWQPA
jgi:mannose-6-phosphate isomerase-like protein (cupin superfamily)